MDLYYYRCIGFLLRIGRKNLFFFLKYLLFPRVSCVLGKNLFDKLFKRCYARPILVRCFRFPIRKKSIWKRQMMDPTILASFVLSTLQEYKTKHISAIVYHPYKNSTRLWQLHNQIDSPRFMFASMYTWSVDLAWGILNYATIKLLVIITVWTVCFMVRYDLLNQLARLWIGLEELPVLFLQLIPHCIYKDNIYTLVLFRFNYREINVRVSWHTNYMLKMIHGWQLTGGGDDWFDVCMFRKSFHAFVFAHTEDQAFFYKMLYLHQTTKT